ncbi:hypothetical protein EGW24_03370 [Enterococcus faecium]|nr:hypothetical protein EGW24_03370 [Enterococcus faecium]
MRGWPNFRLTPCVLFLFHKNPTFPPLEKRENFRFFRLKKEIGGKSPPIKKRSAENSADVKDVSNFGQT